MSTEVTWIVPSLDGPVFDALLQLNNQYAEELSFKTASAFSELLAEASYVRALPDGGALLVAFHDDATYDNPNFHWLKSRYQRFYYIDRVVVGAQHRGKGIARLLYRELEKQACAEKRERLVCEINSDPPNAASDDFHVKLGFAPVGLKVLAGQNKTVRYWCKELV